MPLQQLAQRNAHLLFDIARFLDMSGDAIELGAGVVRPPDGGEPRSTAPHNVRRLRYRLDIVYGGRAAIETDIRRKRRFQPRLALLAFEAFEQCGLLAA